MKNLSYEELSYEVISKYVGPNDIPADKLKMILHKSFSTFRSKGKKYHFIFAIVSEK